MKNRIILRVYENKKSKQKLVTIPKKIKNIKSGDFIEIRKVKIKWTKKRIHKKVERG